MERLNTQLGRFLVFGASGLVGKEILKRLPPSETRGYALSNISENLIAFDVSRIDRLRNEILTQKPETVFWAVNMAGGVNGCETNPAQARTMHFETTQALVDGCLETGSTLVFLSTDYVFSDSDHAVQENEKTAPLNLYGKLKDESEKLIAAKLKNFIIARTTNIYGWDPESRTPNFYMQVFKALSQDRKITAPSCLHGNPTFVGDLVDGIFGLHEKKAYGTFHIVGPENVSRHDWARQIAGSLSKDLKLVEDVDHFQNIPKRPLKIELSTRKIREKIAYHPKGVQEGLRALNLLRTRHG